MSGCLDNCRLPECEWLNLAERRNSIASIISGGMVGSKKGHGITVASERQFKINLLSVKGNTGSNK